MMERHRKKTKLNLKRAGERSKVLRKSGGTEDYTGKVTGGTYSPVTDSDGNDVVEHFAISSGSHIDEQTTTGGTVDVANPTLLVAYDSVVQESDRVIAYGMELQVQNILEYPTHLKVKTTKVDG